MATTSTNNGARVTEPPPETIKTQSSALQWTGRVLTGLTILFMLFDAWGKFTKPSYVSDAFMRLGLPLSMSTTIGALLISTVLYAIPRTGGIGCRSAHGVPRRCGFRADARRNYHVRAGISVIFGILMWGGIYLRECGLRQVFPVKR